jgi:hypothetical protein
MSRGVRLDRELHQGETWDLVMRLYNPDPPDGDGLPRSAVGLVVHLQIRAEARDDATLLASASTVDGRVTTDADGWIRIRLPSAVTAAMPLLGRPRTWWYDVRISEAGDTEPVRYWLHGAIEARPRVTKP